MTIPLDLPLGQQRLLTAVMDAACKVFPPRYRPDACIAAARVLVDVFDRLHVKCRPLAIAVDVFNPAMVTRAGAEGGRLPQRTEEYQQWVEESGCWWLTLGLGEPAPGKWPGHVAVVVWERVLLDLTLPQATRHQHGILLAPAAIQVGPEFLDGSQRRVVRMNGCELHYQAHLDDQTFLRARDWYDRQRHKDVVAAILRLARDQLSKRTGQSHRQQKGP
jgi:hypothetical protein